MLDFSVLRLASALIIGIGLGYLWRNRKRLNLTRITFGAIIVLIFSMGFSIGSNKLLLGSLPSIALQAVIILSLTLFFSALLVKLGRKLVKLE